jgi:hypothetical protein
MGWAVMLGCGPVLSLPGDAQTDDGHGSEGRDASSEPGDDGGQRTTGSAQTSGRTAGSDETSGTSAGSEGGAVELDCARVCSVLARGSCHSLESCEAECFEVLEGESSDVHAAFAACVAVNPLCFETIDMCLWSTLYPDPFEHPVVYSGAGFDAFEGMVVRGGVDAGAMVLDIAEANVRGGEFVLEMTVTKSVVDPHLVMLYVDTDGDGVCTKTVDFGLSAYVPVSGPFEAPVFEGGGGPPESSSDFVCDHL